MMTLEDSTFLPSVETPISFLVACINQTKELDPRWGYRYHHSCEQNGYKTRGVCR